MSEKTDQLEQPAVPDQIAQSKMTLLASKEGRLLLAGIGLALALAAWLGIGALLSPDRAQVLIGTTATGIVFGRAACMAFGYSLGLGHTTVIPICVVIESIFVLVFYPLFVFSWQHLLVIKGLKHTFERVHEAAQAHQAKIQRYGPIGLFVFVWFPFWMTGPLVGSVIGFLLGVKLWLNMTMVLGGSCVAILGWAFLLRHVHDQIAASHPYVLPVVAGAVLVAGGGALLIHQYHRHRKH